MINKGALDGIRVLDLSRVLGGPYCGQILADHGAEVVKVEPPQGDETRGWGPPFDASGSAAYYQGVNRNKRDIVIDLSRPAGRDLVLRLLEGVDVLIENFKVGTMERWGLGHEAVLAKRFPRLVHCRVSGYGADGPLGGVAGYDAVVQAMSGMMSINGSPDAGATRIGVPIVDMATGMAAAIGILLALFERVQSDRGQFIDATLYDTAVSLLHPQSANFLLSGKTPVLTGNAHPNIVPYDKFPTSTGDVFLGIGNDGQFSKLCAALGHAEWATDARFVSNAQRAANRPALRALLESELAQRDGAALCESLAVEGVSAGPVRTIPQALGHAHTLHREMVVEIGDAYRGIGTPIKLSRTPGSMRTAPPRFGEHSRHVLRGAGLTEAEVEALIESGTVRAMTAAQGVPDLD
ncbi:MAG: CaiB/BaiF CoA-transferase family protein [Caldimonas sp.]